MSPDKDLSYRLPQSESDPAVVRLLDAGVAQVNSAGPIFAFDRVSVDALLADAGVDHQKLLSLWGSERALFEHVLVELAGQERSDRNDEGTLLSSWQFLAGRLDELRTSEGRRKILLDLAQAALEYNFESVTTSSKWQTYAALSVTLPTWPAGPGRDRIVSALRSNELAFIETMESFYRNVFSTFGFRLKPFFEDNYAPFVLAASALVEGLGIVRTAIPDLVNARLEIPLPGGNESWALNSYAFVGIFDQFFEEDPDFDAEEAIDRLGFGMDVSPREPETRVE